MSISVLVLSVCPYSALEKGQAVLRQSGHKEWYIMARLKQPASISKLWQQRLWQGLEKDSGCFVLHGAGQLNI